MDLRQLRYFMAVVEEKTVTAAAQRLHMTQPPLTVQLHMLEEELGCRLFQREGRRLELTEAGERLYGRAAEILGMCDSVRQEMADFRQGVAGTLRLGVISSVQGTLFAGWMQAFEQRHPDVSLSIHSGNTYELLARLQNRQIDLAIVRTPFPETGLTVLPLRREAILAVGCERFFRDGAQTEITLQRLARLPLIIYRRWQKIIEASFEAAGCTPRIYCLNDDAAMTFTLASRGLGVGLLHPSALPETLPAAMCTRTLLQDTLVSQIALVCQSEHRLPQTARLFWRMMEALPTAEPRNMNGKKPGTC